MEHIANVTDRHMRMRGNTDLHVYQRCRCNVYHRHQ